MRTRYFRDEKGRPKDKAQIYEKNEHGISRDSIDDDARRTCSRLVSQGYQAYIVGGAVRDLLIGLVPKDFDIATNASPNQVRKIFRHSRIIGKRFCLVHVYFPNKKIHEVSTFRSLKSVDRHHIFGTLNEDVRRRDFSLNALYYDPAEETVIDFVKGVEDIRHKVIRSILPLNKSFLEDPVRMLRAVKYAAITNMRIHASVGRKIKRQAPLLAQASVSRLSEELFKILKSLHSENIFRLMDFYGLFAFLLPQFHQAFLDSKKKIGDNRLKDQFFLNMGLLDQELDIKKTPRDLMLSYLGEKILDDQGFLRRVGKKDPSLIEVIRSFKNLLLPLVQPNRDIEGALRIIFKKRQLKLPAQLLWPAHSSSKRTRKPGKWRQKKKPEILEK